MTAERLDLLLLVAALVLLGAVAAVRLARGLGLPILLAFLGLGLALGESGVGVRFDDAGLAHALGYAALVVILAEGGLTSRWSVVRPGLPAAASLATVGVAVSTAVTAAVAHLVLDLSWRTAVLLGAALAPTDAAATFATLRGLPLRRRLTGVLEAESGLNDPLVVLVVVTLSEHAGGLDPLPLLATTVYELVGGAVVGLVAAEAGARYLRRTALPSAGLYPLAVVGLCLLGYGGAAAAHASGFLAVYVAALRLGRARLPHRTTTVAFAEGLAWLAQIGVFVMLGLLASPGRLPAVVLPALGVGLALLLLARPLAVVAATLPFRFTWPERAFLSWAGLRGAVPVVFATIPLAAGVPGGARLFDTVFVVVVALTVVQGRTLPAVARRLGVSAPGGAAETGIDAAPLGRLDADLLELSIGPGSRLHGVEAAALRLPDGAVLTLVVRDGRPLVPRPDTVLRTGDDLLVVTTAEARAATERRLRAVARRGELAGWLGERGGE